MSTTTTATDYLTALESLGFRSARWDRPAFRQLDRQLRAARRLRVCYDVEEARFSVLMLDGQATEWAAEFTTGTPLEVVKAVVAKTVVDAI